VIPVYDMGSDAAELIAENAAIQCCSKVLIGSSRHGALYHLVKGRFQERLEALLPPEIPVQVIRPEAGDKEKDQNKDDAKPSAVA
jgi:K+-sensing histidine kinase KdpD